MLRSDRTHASVSVVWEWDWSTVYDIGGSAREVLGLTDGDIQCSAVLVFMIPVAKSFGRSG